MEMPNVSILKTEPINVPAIASQYQQLVQNQNMMPIQKQQAQASLQSQLTQNESDKLKLEQQAREMAFKNWSDKNPPVIDPTGNIDSGATYKQMTDAGFGQFALSHMAQNLTVAAQNVSNRDQVNQLAVSQAKLLSQANQNQPIEKQKTVQGQADNFFKSKFGVSLSEVLGDNWITSSKYQAVSPIEMRASQRSDEQTLTSPEAKDPNSNLNKAFQKFVQTNSPELFQPGMTLFASQSIPGLNESIKSFLVTQPQRSEATQAQKESTLKIDKLKGIKDDFNKIAMNYSIRPLDKIVNVLKRIVSSTDQANLQQIISRLKAEGIDVSTEDNASGWLTTIDARIKELESNKQMSSELRRSPSFSSSSPAASPVGVTGTKFRMPSGKIYTIPSDQLNNPQVQQKLKSAGAVRVN